MNSCRQFADDHLSHCVRYSLEEPCGYTTPAGDIGTLLQGSYQTTWECRH